MRVTAIPGKIYSPLKKVGVASRNAFTAAKFYAGNALRSVALSAGFSLFGLGLGAVATGCITNAPSEICKSGAVPNLAPLETFLLTPDSVDIKDLEEGITFTWETESPVSNCNGSHDLRVVIHFRDGDQEFYPDPATGLLKIEKTFNRKFGAITGDLIYFNPNTEREETLSNKVTLWPPEIIEDTTPPDQCEDYPNPRIQGIIEMDKTDVYVGEPVIFSIPAHLITQCDGTTGAEPENQLKVSFIIGNNPSPVEEDGGRYSSLPHTFPASRNQTVFLKAEDEARPNSEATIFVDFYVKERGVDSPPDPNLSILAPYSAEIDTAVNVQVKAPNTDFYAYSFHFGDDLPDVEIPGTNVNHIFTALGTYSVTLIARLLSDPSVEFKMSQNISIVPYPVPNVGINGPLSAPVNTSVNFFVPDPTPGATYTWEFGDGAFDSGTDVGHTYTSTGNFQVRLTGDLNGSTNSILHNITVF